uniref:Protein AAR2 homolog n=1 Tax=Sinocyclocheilus grahami TaxID=75366 RepID=A0A672NKV7_SINGR
MAGTDMDPEVARGLFEEGATLVLLGVPQGSVLGLDYKPWTLGRRFRGVKMIPPGLHFLNSNEACGDIGPKTGLLLSLKPREVLVAHWNQREDDLEFTWDPEEAERMRANLRELLRSHSVTWIGVTLSTLCLRGIIKSSRTLLMKIYYHLCTEILSYRMSLFAGELQFALVCFLMGNVCEFFEHWKSLQALPCRSEEAVKERKELYPGLIAVLCHQLGEIPPHFFVDIVLQNDFLPSTLQVPFMSRSSRPLQTEVFLMLESSMIHCKLIFRFGFNLNLINCHPTLFPSVLIVSCGNT